jgi:ABC-type nitrate/sulfonate/bicarbonate transport system substrate-binding protein
MQKVLWALLSFFTLLNSMDGTLAADKVRIGVPNPNMTFLPGWVAVKNGFFRDEGLEVEVIRMRVPIMVTAISTGDLDYTMLFGSVVRAAIRGLPVKVVTSLLDSSTHALVSQPEFKSVKELKGKSLGVESIGATSDVAARLMFKHYGVDPEKEIKVLGLGPDRARLAALKEKLVQVVSLAPPADVEAQKMGFNVLARAYELFSFPFAGLATSVKKINERPAQVKGAIKALIRANRFIREHRDAAVQVLAEWGRVEREIAASAYDSTIKVFSPDGTIPEEGLRLVIEQARKEANITREIALSEVSDVTILREAQRELGIKGR